MQGSRKDDLVRHYFEGSLSRRSFTMAAASLGLSAITVDRVLARQTPPGVVSEQPQVSYPLTTEGETLRILVSSDPQIEDWNTNAMTLWYEERTGVHIEWEVVSSADALTQLNLRLASGDYPDIIMGIVPSPSSIQIYGAQGIFLPLNELIEEHGVFIKELFAAYPDTQKILSSPDGNLYSMPEINDCDHCAYSRKMWLYKPWLDALGLSVPQTTEDFRTVLKAFAERDPNGNGQNDEIPLVSSPDLWNGGFDLFLMNSFLYNPGGNRLFLRDGRVTAVFAQPEWQEGLKYLASLYADGLIDPESFTQNIDGLRRHGNAPDAVVVGACPGGYLGEWVNVDEENGGRWTEYISVPPLEGPKGVRLASFHPYEPYINGKFIVTDKCPNPALAVRWADGFYEMEAALRAEYGVLGEDWRWAEPGEVGVDGEEAIWDVMGSYNQQPNRTWVQKNPSYRPLRLRLARAVTPEEENRNLISFLYRATQVMLPYAQPAEWTLPPLTYSVEQAEQVVELSTTLDPFVDETIVRVIRGEMQIDDEWDSYVQQLEQQGLTRYLDVVQAAYTAQLGS